MLHRFAIKAPDGSLSGEFMDYGSAWRARPNPSDTVVAIEVDGPFETIAASTADPAVKALCAELARRFG